MFENIGGKIKMVAAAVCWIGIIAFVILGVAIMSASDDAILPGFLVMILGSLFSWIGSFMTYGFGQLIQNSDIIVEQLKKNPTKSFSIKSTENIPVKNKTDEVRINTQKAMTPPTIGTCQYCGREAVLVRGSTITDGVNSSIASLCEQCIDELKSK